MAGAGVAERKKNKMPPGVPYIIGNEAAERFSYYGMNSVLVVFMMHHLLSRTGADDHMTREQALTWYHTFVAAVYFLPILGAFLADAFIGKFWTILSLSVVYCMGHLALAIDHTRMGLATGLLLIAMGAGGIKPCVSAFVGDQFTAENQHLLTRVFTWFYFAINSGSAVSTVLIPWLLESDGRIGFQSFTIQIPTGPSVAFGVPGIFMGIATVIIWLGRKKYIGLPPTRDHILREYIVKKYADFRERGSRREFWTFQLFNTLIVLFLALVERNLGGRGIVARCYGIAVFVPTIAVTVRRMHDSNLSGLWAFIPIVNLILALRKGSAGNNRFGVDPSEGPPEFRKAGKAFTNLLLPVPFAAMFWALWQQNFSSWIVQAEKMDRHIFGFNLLAAQVQTVNPVFILLMLPLFSYVIYPALSKVFRLTPLRKIGIGLFVTVVSFSIVGLIQRWIDAGQHPHVAWQILAFAVLSAGEIMVSVTHLEFAYTQAPPKFKSLAVCSYLGAVSLGNVFTAYVDHAIQNPDGTVRLQGAAYFDFFTLVLLGTAVLFVLVSPFYRGHTYAQSESPA